MPGIANRIASARRSGTEWAAQPVKARLRILGRFRQALPTHVDRLVAAVESRRPRAPGETIAAEILPLAEAVRFLEMNAAQILAPRYEPSSFLPLWLTRTELEIRREPCGVILIIGPSNYPLMLPGIQAAQALAAGNAVLIKPGVGGSPSMQLFAKLLTAAGLNSELCQVLSEDPESAQEAIATGVDKVILTGSAGTGRKVMQQLASSLTPSVMELSGCDAVFVLADADLDLVVRALLFGMRLNSSATCIAPRRVFAHERIADDLTSRLTAAFQALPSCRPPPAWAARARRLVKEALAQGAVCLAGNIAEAEAFSPTLLGSVNPKMAAVNEDITAPVLSVFSVANDEEALVLSAQCRYALGATVFGSESKAMELAGRIKAGTVVVNDMIAPTADPRLPFGGRGRSGFGVTRGREGLLEMTRVKTICTRHGYWRPHLDPPVPASGDLMRAYLTASHGATLWERLGAMKRTIGALIRMRRTRDAQDQAEGTSHE